MKTKNYLSIMAITTVIAFISFGLIGVATAQEGPHQQCSNCHESSQVQKPVSINYSSELCGQSGCHPGIMEEWKESGHTSWSYHPEGNTLDDFPVFATTCSCHFTEGGVWDLKTGECAWDSNTFNPFNEPSTANKNDMNPGVDCAACHNPHTKELRINGSMLCGSCHNGQGTCQHAPFCTSLCNATFDVTTGFQSHHPNHPNYEQWTGETFEWADPSEFITGHSDANVTANCTACHTSHTFEWSPQAVVESNTCDCHNNLAEFEQTVNSSMNEFETRYEEVYAEMEETANKMGVDIHGGATDHPKDFTAAYQEEYTKLSKAVFYLEMVTGEGALPTGAIAVHNKELGTQLVSKAETLLEEIDVPDNSSPQLTLTIETTQDTRRTGEQITLKATYNEEPIQGVLLSVGDQTATTSEQGTATFTFAEPGKYEVTATHEKYQSTSTQITVVKTYEGQIAETLSSIENTVNSVQNTVNSVQDSVSGLTGEVETTIQDAISDLESKTNYTMYLAALALIAILVAIALIYTKT